MNPLIVLALIAALQKEVLLLETELAQQTAVVATTSYQPMIQVPVSRPAYIQPTQPIVTIPAVPSVQPIVRPQSQTLGAEAPTSTPVAWQGYNSQDESHASTVNHADACPPGDPAHPIYEDASGTWVYPTP